MIPLYRVHLPFHRIRLLFALIFLSIFTSKALLAQSDYAIGTAKDFGDIELINRGETSEDFVCIPTRVPLIRAILIPWLLITIDERW